MMIRTIFSVLSCVLIVSALSACGGAAADLEDAAISSRDVPEGWLPADLDDVKGQALWNALPALLTEDVDARLILHAFEAESGLHGAATLLIETDNAAAIPEAAENDDVLGPLSQLLESEDALLLPNPRGGDPKAYFAVSDTPLPGSIRSRLIRLMDDELVHSDSLTFSVGNVLAVVTVWYPEKEGPIEELNEIANRVETRLQSLVTGS
ncbi:MAG: hypothetical protein J4N95_05275 [Chloroflexi bacterium]|nr:hypothetical protein [Chloroflexota bacterium]MCI0855616.1 hypothetical protein [Chloroflexota bacterium]MCI0889919.1 hypothetical protein [Chloroflexota bacterium]